MPVYGRTTSQHLGFRAAVSSICSQVIVVNRADPPRFFRSWFHCLDATVISAAFIIDVVLKGVLEEVGSIVVVLRLWRVFKVNVVHSSLATILNWLSDHRGAQRWSGRANGALARTFA